MTETQDPANSTALSIAMIVPERRLRGTLAAVLSGSRANIVREFDSYPSHLSRGELAGLACDAAIVDLDQDTERAIEAIEEICRHDSDITVMAVSAKNDAMLLRRAMQAGAREFLLQPLSSEMVTEAFSRALARRPKHQKKGMGKVFVFVPSKGGVGATTIATTFAMALTKESGARVVAVDMDFQLGEIALGLGMSATFSIVDALKNADRLDWDFLSSLLIKHRSGLSVLAAPEEYSFFQLENNDAAARLFRILRAEFDYIVVDAGTSYGQLQEAIFELADKLYLVTELTLPSLRNSHRLITHLTAPNGRRQLEVVVNRFNSRNGDIDEGSATKALGRPINWRVPNGYAAARSAQDNGIPLALESTPITKAVIQMAKAACGKPHEESKKSGGGFSFFGSKTVTNTVEI